MSNTSNESRPKRRWFRFRLRTLLIVLTLFTVMLGAWHGYVEPYRVQRRAGSRLQAKGAYVTWQPAGPQWMRAIFGEDNFGEAISVSWSNKPIYHLSDEELEDVGLLTSLRELTLPDSPFTDDGLVHLQGLSELTLLRLSLSDITGEGLQSLEGLTKLEKLDLGRRNSMTRP